MSNVTSRPARPTRRHIGTGLAAALLLLPVLTQGCVSHHGPRVTQLTPLVDRGGAVGHVEIQLGSARWRVEGELIDVGAGGLRLLVSRPSWSPAGEPRLASVNWQSMGRYDFEGVRGQGIPGSSQHALLASVSRYPPGLSDTQLRELLEHLGQAAVDRLSDIFSPVPQGGTGSTDGSAAEGVHPAVEYARLRPCRACVADTLVAR
jgi:hypothetical protein